MEYRDDTQIRDPHYSSNQVTKAHFFANVADLYEKIFGVLGAFLGLILVVTEPAGYEVASGFFVVDCVIGIIVGYFLGMLAGFFVLILLPFILLSLLGFI